MTKFLTIADLKKAVVVSDSFSEVLGILGMTRSGSSHASIKKKCKQWEIDTSHFQHKTHIRNKKRPRKLSLEDVLVENSTYNRGHLKLRLWNERLLERECEECGLGETWNGKPISLHLDHVNGINNDNRLCNLRILCPNCHSQTETFCGKNIKPKQQVTNFCIDCLSEISRRALRCCRCANKGKSRKKKIEWPEDDILAKMVFEKPMSAMSKDLGVSDVAIKKHCLKRNIKMPKRGFFLQKKE